jgi:hydrogenase nickel incorporation protein HypB
MKVPVVTRVMKANDSVAQENRSHFEQLGIEVVNVMASPGAGKTSFILATVERLDPAFRPGVIEGDLASSIDADKIAAQGVPVVQINTGGNCHLDAPMIRTAFEHLPTDEIDVLFIENVGNLICPSNYRLGEDLNVVVSSVPEGFDKPHKYPGIFAGADVVLVNKSDLMDVFAYDLDFFTRGVRQVNPDAPIMPISCTTGEGVQVWVDWLEGVLAPASAG